LQLDSARPESVHDRSRLLKLQYSHGDSKPGHAVVGPVQHPDRPAATERGRHELDCDYSAPLTAAEELLEIIMRRYERASTMLTSNRPVEDWGKLLGDAAAVSAMLDRLLHHGHVLKCGPRSWRTKTDLPPQEAAG
jgi:IstB-like ATP binding protein